MKLPRFRLSSVLICFTVVALVLGYTQVRRRHLNKSFAELRAKGCNAPFEDHWLWPAPPQIAGVIFRDWSNGTYSLEHAKSGDSQDFASMSEVTERFQSLRSELLALDVEVVNMLVVRRVAGAGEQVDVVVPDSTGL